MGSRLNYLDTHSSRQRGQIHSHTHTQTHTPFLFGILPCLPHCSAECFPLPLSYALPVSHYLPLFDFLLLFSLPILSFFSFFLPPFPTITVSFLHVVTISPSQQPWSLPVQSFSYFLSLASHQLSSLTHSYSPCPFLLSSLPRCLSIFLCLFAPLLTLYPLSFSPTLSHFPYQCYWVTSSILYGVPRDMSVISRSLISKSSSWQRTRHAEEHRHKARHQLMRPRTPTTTITHPLQHWVSSQLNLVRWAVEETADEQL